ncbi:MAG: LacI family DNA-binding transcriptional regulator, partial [Anaerolineales bacterium]
MVRIRDVAKQLNLSITTVSRALDGYDDVAEQTRQLVVRTAQEMGYTPNRAARQLRRRRADTIGYILPAAKPAFSGTFLSEFISGLGDEAALHNYDLLISAAEPNSMEEHTTYQRWVQSGKVDGVVLNRVRLHDWRIQYLTAQKVPIACLERSLDAFEFFGVEVDSYSGFLELTHYLVGLG